MEFLQEIWFYLGITGAGAVSVVISTTVLYMFVATVLHFYGPRLSATPSVLAFTVLTVLGAVCARAMLGNSPTMVGALIAVSVLLVLESLLGRITRHVHWPRKGKQGARRPVVVMVDGVARAEVLRRRHLTERQLLSRLRREGLHQLTDAGAVILETRGTLTIIRDHEPVEDALLDGVQGRELIPERLIVR